MKKEAREGYKFTELGEIPNEWNVGLLGDKAYIKARIGWRGLTAEEYTNKGPLLIAGKHIKGSSILWDECDHISKERYEESSEIKLINNDIIMTKDGTIGRVAFIDKLPYEATINGTMMLIRPNNEFYSKYLYFYFQGNQFQSIVREKISGSSVPHIFQRDLVNLKVPVPTLEEQKKIAKILSTVDKQIENIEKLIQKNQELKKGLMQQLLTKGIGHTEFKKTELGEIPVEWEVIYLENIFEILDSYRKPIKASERELMRGNIPYYGASGIIDWVNDYIFDEELILLGEDGENLSSRNLDLAFKISGKSWINNHAHVFKIKDNKKHDIDFMVYYLESKDYSKYIAGSAQPKITQSQCRKFLLPSPTFEEQKKISLVLLEVDERIKEYQNKKEKLEKLKKGLMQSLLTGKIRLI